VKSFAHNRADHWTKQIAHRGADLVVVMVGANEASWLPPGKTAMADYAAQYAAILAPIRQALPESTCLVVSPLDQAHVTDDNELAPRPVMPMMVAAQRRAAAESGCAFFSAYEWAGGRGSSLKWHARGWIGDDFQHLSLEGAQKLGDAIVDALLAGAQDYQARTP
jgi:lysophospholipase L1-like esterase